MKTVTITLDQAHGAETLVIQLGPNSSLAIVDAVALNDAGEPAGTYTHTGVPFSEITKITLAEND